MTVNRRAFLQLTGTAFLSATMPVRGNQQSMAADPVRFPQGVASGDPSHDSLVFWTRAEPTKPGGLSVQLQISTEQSFHKLVVDSTLTTNAEQDYTVRAQVDKLQPFTRYYYRFISEAGTHSIAGRTLTAPAPDSDESLQLAFASCQNYEQGYLGAWGRMLTEDKLAAPEDRIHCVLHLGDFIYERYRNRAADGQSFVRRLPRFPQGARDGKTSWASTLSDYRHLYKTYLSDPYLQAARARWPFVCTWDDHEFSNDGYQDFNTYNDSRHFREPERKASANQAWYEYIPARVDPDASPFKIHRSLKWGRHTDLLITDLRSHRSASNLPHNLAGELDLPLDAVELVKIVDGGRDYNHGNPPATLPFGDGTHANPAREAEPGTMLGQEQKQWFKDALQASTATWKIWGNSLPALPLRLDLGSIPLLDYPNGILSADAWAGYPSELQELMQHLEDEGITGLVSLSGDHHMHGAGLLNIDPDQEEPIPVAVDFNVTGISSTTHFSNVKASDSSSSNAMFEQMVVGEEDGETVPVWNLTLSQGVIAALAWSQSGSSQIARWLGPNPANPGLAYVDADSHGYGLARFQPEHCEVSLVTVASALQQPGPEGSEIRHQAHFSLARWGAGEKPHLKGPSFDGKPPFPY